MTGGDNQEGCFSNITSPGVAGYSIMSQYPKYISIPRPYVVGDEFTYDVWTVGRYSPAGGCSQTSVQYKVLNVMGDSLQIQETSSEKDVTYSLRIGDSIVPKSFTPISNPFGFPQQFRDSLYHISFQGDSLYAIDQVALFDTKFGLLDGMSYANGGSQRVLLSKYNSTTVPLSVITQWDDSIVSWIKKN